MEINVDENVHFQALNRIVRESKDTDITINGVVGQRYIADGLSGKRIIINGVPGNALGAYMNGCEVIVHGNVQEATGDTMNSGKIVVYGNAGDATGYAMRGGRIYIRDNIGYRAGIHMKAYMDFKPAIVVGGRAGSFLGEYQAGGVIVVLGQNKDGLPIINNFCGTGMHGGVMYLRCDELPRSLPSQVSAVKKWGADIEELAELVREWCNFFPEYDSKTLLCHNFFVLTANTDNPYKQMYTNN